MNQFCPSQVDLITILSDGRCHNENELSQTMDIATSTLWEQIEQLIHFGIPILRLPHHSIQLPHPLILLDEQNISKGLLSQGLTTPFTYIYLLP